MKITWRGELTPRQENASLLAGVAITLIAFGSYKVISYRRKKASERRVSAMVAERMPEVEASTARLKERLENALVEHRKKTRDILQRSGVIQ